MTCLCILFLYVWEGKFRDHRLEAALVTVITWYPSSWR